MRGALSVAAVLVPVSLLAGPKTPPRGPISVHLTVREAAPLSAEERAAMEQRAKTLEAEFEELSKSYKKQHGKKQEKWAADVQAAYYAALDIRNTAVTDVWYAAPDPKDQTDSLEDVRKAFDGVENKHGWVQLVDSRDEADLVVQLLGRYGGPKVLVGGKQIGFEMLPGRIGADALSAVPREWSREMTWANLYVDHWLTPAEPFYRFEVGHNERWRDVAKMVVAAVVAFTKDNYDTLKPQ